MLVTASCADNFVCPDSEGVQRVGAERRRDGDVGRVATSRQQDPTDARRVVPRIERVPLTAEIGFEPGREIAGRMGWWCADVTQISRAVASRYVQCAAERDGQVSIVTAHAAFFFLGLRRGPRYSRMLVAEGDVLMHEIANRLHARPTGIGLTEVGPRQIEQSITVAEPACNEEDEGLLRKKLDRNLRSV